MKEIFISYRHSDEHFARTLRDSLSLRFGNGSVFLDDRGIEVGRDFPRVLTEALDAAEIFLAVIGPGWLAEIGRLADPEDFVRRETFQALGRRNRGTEIVPITVGAVAMPAKDILPQDVQALADIQAESWDGGHAGLDRIGDLIDRYCGGLLARRQNAWLLDALLSVEKARHCLGQDISVLAPDRFFVPRQSATAQLEEWWASWALHRKPFVLLGEEGDGKSWALAAWLADKIQCEAASAPIVYAAGTRCDKPEVTEILAACLERSLPSGREQGWKDALRQLGRQAVTDKPRFLLVVDALNEHPSQEWSRFFDSCLVEDWGARIAVIVVCRLQYWQTHQPTPAGTFTDWTLPHFNDAELDCALALHGLQRGAFTQEVLELMAKPRYFNLARQLHDNIEEGGITVDRLIYESWKLVAGDRQHLSDDDFQALISSLAGRYRNQFSTGEFASEAAMADPAALLDEMLSARILERTAGKLHVSPRYLTLGMGLLLAYKLEELAEFDDQKLDELIATSIGDIGDNDRQVSIIAMALCHTMVMTDYPEAGRLALFRAWLAGRNLNEEDVQRIVAYLPMRPETYMRMAEHLWSESGNVEAQDAFMVGFLRFRDRPSVRAAMVQAFTRWLGFVYPCGFRGLFDTDAEKLNASRIEVEKNLGRSAEAGAIANICGCDVEVTANKGLLRLGQVALAVISHNDGKPFVRALLTGMVTTAVMDGSRAEYWWVLRILSEETRQHLLDNAGKLIEEATPVGYAIAWRLLGALGSEAALRLRESIPSEHHIAHPLAKMREEDPCARFFGRWTHENYLDCLERTRANINLVAEQLKELALDPDIFLPLVYVSGLGEAVQGLNLSEVAKHMGRSREELILDDVEPALCAFAPGRHTQLMRALAQELIARNGLPRKQLCWRIYEQFPALGPEELRAVESAWRSTLSGNEEHDRYAEYLLFAMAAFDKPADEQLRLFLERGTQVGYFCEYRPQYRPLEPQHWSLVETALTTASDQSAEHLNCLLWYLSETLQSLNAAIRSRLLEFFDKGSDQTRCQCLAVFLHTHDKEAASSVIRTGWRNINGKERRWENRLGSVLLSELGQELQFAELATRINPEWLGYALSKRGKTPEEMADYAVILNAIWHHNLQKFLPPPSPNFCRHVEIKVDAKGGWDSSRLSVRDDSGGAIKLADSSWGGKSDVGSVEDMKHAFDTDWRTRKYQALLDQVVALVEAERESGNPWFDHSFHHGQLADVVTQNDAPWREWLAAVLPGRPEAVRLLCWCRGFYEELCAALLDHSPSDGVALFHALTARPTINITDSLTGLPYLLLDVFKAKESPEVDELCRKALEDCNTDLALFQITLVCRFGTRQAWLNRLIGNWLESGRGYDQARALALLGFGKDADEGRLLDEWISTHGDCWLREVATESLKRQRRNAWAMRWFECYLATEDRPRAWAYFRLFLRCIDRRVWLWLDKVGLENAQEWKREAVSANHGVIVAAIKENEKGWEDYFLGQKVMKRELWPWMENYFQ